MTAPQIVSLETALQQAVAHHQAGRLQEAESLYRTILQAVPGQPDANHNLGVLACQVGQHGAGLPFLKAALDANPSQGQYWLSYGEALLASGRAEEALKTIQAAIQHGHDSPAAQSFRQRAVMATDSVNSANGKTLSQGEIDQLVALFNASRYMEMETQARLLIERYPDSGVAWKGLSTALQMQGKDALSALQRAAQYLPADAEAHYNLGVALHEHGEFQGAVASCRRALKIQPNFAEAHNNLGNALRDLGQSAAALASYRQALKNKPDYAEAHNNLGVALQELGQLDRALASYRRALQIEPGYAEAQFNLALGLLLLGDYGAGLEFFEGRFTAGRREHSLSAGILSMLAGIPRWGRQDLQGKTLLVWSEQGLGDSLMMLRYLPMLASLKPGRVVVYCERGMVEVMRTFRIVNEVILRGVDLGSRMFDYHCPMMSLPFIFQTRLDNIPCQVPYLFVSDRMRDKWGRRLSPLAGIKVGLVWAGNKALGRDLLRSIPLQKFAPLRHIAGVSFVSLQKGDAAVQIAGMGWPLHDWMDECEDLLDTAALVANLDLVISVDTSVAHLAGALGKPVWLLNRFESEWRWMLKRSDSPWYPTLRIFRQTALGDWGSVMERVASELAGQVEKGATCRATSPGAGIEPGFLS